MDTPTISFANNQRKVQEVHEIAAFQDFLNFHVEKSSLPIGKYLPMISDSPVFIVAATGVGKTVGVPMHVFLRLCQSLISAGDALEPLPHVYVVEPTIPICTREMEHMNSAYHAFMTSRGEADPTAYNPFGAITGPTGRLNGNAPVLFITTGVFERIARSDDLDPARARFILDEAHRTLSQSDGVEIAVAVARKRGAIVDFMSATVDTTTLSADLGVKVISATEQRYPVILKSTKAPMEECVGELAVRCLLHPETSPVPNEENFSRDEDRARARRTRLHLLSREQFVDEESGQTFKGLSERPQGMLVIVNSHHGEQSDTRRIAERLKAAFAGEPGHVEVLRLASAVVRDEEQMESFRRRVEGIERRNGRYVIVATNVVEMGVTFPSLDYVVTMDTELETVEQYGGSVIREVPLSVNGLFQRVGRVGRSRPGAAFITREETESGEHAAYSLWDEGQLATGLKLERVSYAIQQGHVRELAFFLYESSVPQDLEPTKNFLASFPFPSAPHKNPATLRSLREERLRIRGVGLTDDGVSLNVIGHKFREIAVVQDLHLGKMLAYCLVQKKPSMVLYVALVAAASESKTLRDILGRRTYLEDPTALRLKVPFPQEEFSEPLTSVYILLGTVSTGNLPDVESVTASEETAHHIIELLESGYRPEEPTAPGATGADAEPAVLFLSKPVIPLDHRSEVISTFNIISYFFNRYRRELRNPLYSEFEISRVRQALRSECVDLGLNPFAVESVLGRVAEVARHARVRLQQADADSRSTRADDIVRTALSCQLEIDCATSVVDKGALPELEAHLSGGVGGLPPPPRTSTSAAARFKES